jgi:vacuolar-type H+-ATPase subunit I/STV1
MKDPNKDKVDELLNELEMIHDELDSNQLEQAGLRSLERGLKERLEKVQEELDDLDIEYD